MLTIKKIITLSCVAAVMGANAQNYKISTKVVNTYGESLKDAVGIIAGDSSVKADGNGSLTMNLKRNKLILTVS